MPKAKPDSSEMKDIAATLRDLNNWVFVFAKEYDLPKEAVDTLHKKVDEIAKKLAVLSCR